MPTGWLINMVITRIFLLTYGWNFLIESPIQFSEDCVAVTKGEGTGRQIRTAKMWQRAFSLLKNPRNLKLSTTVIYSHKQLFINHFQLRIAKRQISLLCLLTSIAGWPFTWMQAKFIATVNYRNILLLFVQKVIQSVVLLIYAIGEWLHKRFFYSPQVAAHSSQGILSDLSIKSLEVSLESGIFLYPLLVTYIKI